MLINHKEPDFPVGSVRIVHSPRMPYIDLSNPEEAGKKKVKEVVRYDQREGAELNFAERSIREANLFERERFVDKNGLNIAHVLDHYTHGGGGEAHVVFIPSTEMIAKAAQEGKIIATTKDVSDEILRQIAMGTANLVFNLRQQWELPVTNGHRPLTEIQLVKNRKQDTSVGLPHWHVATIRWDQKDKPMAVDDLADSMDRVRATRTIGQIRQNDKGRAAVHCALEILADDRVVGNLFHGETHVNEGGSAVVLLPVFLGELLRKEEAVALLRILPEALQQGCNAAGIPQEQQCSAYALVQRSDKGKGLVFIGAADHFDIKTYLKPVHGGEESMFEWEKGTAVGRVLNRLPQPDMDQIVKFNMQNRRQAVALNV